MTDPQPPWVAPFVLDTPDVPRERHGHWDLYPALLPAQSPGSREGGAAAAGPFPASFAGRPDSDTSRPLVMFVHGGPVNPAWPASPRDWHVYRGYGAQAASRGFAGAVVDHRLTGGDAYPEAYGDVLEAVEAARADERVDADRVAVWVFSGGGPMLAPLLRDRPSWLKVLGASYPALDSFLDIELAKGFRPLDELATAAPIPLVFTRVGLERDFLAPAQDTFLEQAVDSQVAVELIEVPEGVHGFDQANYTDESRAAVELALDKVLFHLS